MGFHLMMHIDDTADAEKNAFWNALKDAPIKSCENCVFTYRTCGTRLDECAEDEVAQLPWRNWKFNGELIDLQEGYVLSEHGFICRPLAVDLGKKNRGQ